mmetsp:Transcript_973/g.3042  ORF Transcript_973/g.3042 Transcript_973/m.3042 type:complete len:259 (-) Transcript_973:6-782(-)
MPKIVGAFDTTTRCLPFRHSSKRLTSDAFGTAMVWTNDMVCASTTDTAPFASPTKTYLPFLLDNASAAGAAMSSPPCGEGKDVSFAPRRPLPRTYGARAFGLTINVEPLDEALEKHTLAHNPAFEITAVVSSSSTSHTSITPDALDTTIFRPFNDQAMVSTASESASPPPRLSPSSSSLSPRDAFHVLVTARVSQHHSTIVPDDVPHAKSVPRRFQAQHVVRSCESRSSTTSSMRLTFGGSYMRNMSSEFDAPVSRSR